MFDCPQKQQKTQGQGGGWSVKPCQSPKFWRRLDLWTQFMPTYAVDTFQCCIALFFKLVESCSMSSFHSIYSISQSYISECLSWHFSVCLVAEAELGCVLIPQDDCWDPTDHRGCVAEPLQIRPPHPTAPRSVISCCFLPEWWVTSIALDRWVFLVISVA